MKATDAANAVRTVRRMEDAVAPPAAATLHDVLQAAVCGSDVSLGSSVLFDRLAQRLDSVRDASLRITRTALRPDRRMHNVLVGLAACCCG